MTSQPDPAAAVWDAEYAAGRYASEQPVAFTSDILAAARRRGVRARASAGSEPGAQDGGGLVDRGPCGAGFPERVEQHEVVDHAVEPHGRHGDPGRAELGGVRLSLIAQHVCLVHA